MGRAAGGQRTGGLLDFVRDFFGIDDDLLYRHFTRFDL